MSRIWKFKDTNLPPVSKELVEAAGGIPMLAKLLAIRGITDPTEAHAFLNIHEYSPTPGLTEFPDMEKSLERVIQAIDAQEPILIFGDFDVDGVTGTSILLEGLKAAGANVSFYIPNRHTEGHGLNSTALIRLVSARQIKVVISTDTGITNFNEVSLLNGLGVDTIITDHHELPENLPPAYAILNPKLLADSSPFAYMSGAGVSFKFCEALLETLGKPQEVIDNLLDLTAIGTVVDMVPLKRENRYLVWRGLQHMQHRKRLGLRTLLEEAGVNETAPITTTTLGFVIGPRMNAIGRLEDSSDAVNLMTTQDPEQARQLAAKLEQLNRQRREMVEQCVLQAETHLINSGELTGQKAIIICSRDWNQGIVGLMATRLIEKHNRPCFVGCIDDETQEIRFSARSIPDFHMVKNLEKLEDLFIRWGGHSGAAGFSIAQKDLPTLKSRLFQVCAEQITDEQMVPITTVDMALTLSQINPHLIDIVEKMAPFGMENPLPVFALEHATIGAQKMMGEDKRHLKLIIQGEGNAYLEAIQWNWGADRPKLDTSSKYRLAFTAEMNTYNGNSKVQLLLKDIQDESQSLAVANAVMRHGIQSTPPVTQAPNPVVAETAQAPAPAGEPENDLFQWVDHRQRDDIDSFLGQVIEGLGDNSLYRIFCEGTQHFLPFPVPESVICARQNGSSSEHLILWDVPPDMAGLIQLLSVQQPKVVHIVGGKYQKMPLYRAPREVAEGFLKLLQKQGRQSGNATNPFNLSQLASVMSTTPLVVVTGLSLLNRLNRIQTVMGSDGDQVHVTLLDPPQDSVNMVELIEYVTFKNALDEVYGFREWLMSKPLNMIKSVVALELQSGRSVPREERERNVINLR